MKWNDSVLEAKKISSGEIRNGFKSKVLIQEGKKSEWYDEEIIEYSPFDKLAFQLKGKSLGKLPMMIVYKLAEVDGGVKISLDIEWLPSGFMLKLLHRIIEIMANKNVDADLNKLKVYLENI